MGLHSDLSLQSVVNSLSARSGIRLASGVHDFKPASGLLDSYFLSLYKFNRRVFFLLVGCGHIVGLGSSVFSAFIEVNMK